MDTKLSDAAYASMRAELHDLLEGGKRTVEVAKQTAKAMRRDDRQRLAKLGYSMDEGGQVFFGEGLGDIIDTAKNETTKLFVAATMARISKWLRAKTPREVTLFVHRLIDEQVVAYEKEFPGDVKCRSGCSACCHQQVLVTEDEARLLTEASAVVSIPDVPHVVRLNQQAAWPVVSDRLGKTAPGVGWQSRDFQARRCPFLGDDNLCKVYDARPLACRNHRSVGDPILCDEEQFPGGEVPSPNQYPIAVVVSALVQFVKLKPMAKAIMEVTR